MCLCYPVTSALPPQWCWMMTEQPPQRSPTQRVARAWSPSLPPTPMAPAVPSTTVSPSVPSHLVVSHFIVTILVAVYASVALLSCFLRERERKFPVEEFLEFACCASHWRSFLSSPVVTFGCLLWRSDLEACAIKSGVEQQNLVVILFYWFIFSFCHYACFLFVE